MRVITLWQPWAWAVTQGLKRVETRSWSTKYRGPIAIHAAMTTKHIQPYAVNSMLDRACVSIRSPAAAGFTRGCIIAAAYLLDVVRIDRRVPQVPIGGGVVNQIRVAPDLCVILSDFVFGDYSEGRYAWILDQITPLERHILHMGAQGMRTLTDDKRARVEAEVAHSEFGA